MNTKQLVLEKPTDTLNNLDLNSEIEKKNISARADINKLMLKVRKEKSKERKENLIFVGLVSSVVLITGLIASF